MTRKLLSALLLAAVCTAPSGASAQAHGFKLVVHEANPARSLTPQEASKLFLKKAPWPNGMPVLPVDLTERSPVRKAFTSTVHGRPVSAVKAYWRQKVFSGREAQPPEQADDTRVLEYVATNPGAIGYVSESTAVGRGVKVVACE